jgi:hypothetical protein
MREPKTHMLKIEGIHLRSLMTGDKKAEIRQNDRNYHVGDILSFNHGNPLRKAEFIEHEHMELQFIITHMLFSEGLYNGYVMLSVQRIKQ